MDLKIDFFLTVLFSNNIFSESDVFKLLVYIGSPEYSNDFTSATCKTFEHFTTLPSPLVS